MENMLKRIMDMDRQAQKIIDAARQEKLEAERTIARQTEELRESYLDRTRRRIQINAENERTILRQNWRRKEAGYQKQKRQMEQTFAEKGDEWAAALADRVIRG